MVDYSQNNDYNLIVKSNQKEETNVKKKEWKKAICEGNVQMVCFAFKKGGVDAENTAQTYEKGHMRS